jgi:hypothetical protein
MLSQEQLAHVRPPSAKWGNYWASSFSGAQNRPREFTGKTVYIYNNNNTYLQAAHVRFLGNFNLPKSTCPNSTCPLIPLSWGRVGAGA